MSWTFISDRKCRARKPHRCIICASLIGVGEDQVVRRGIEDGEGPASHHMHIECEEFSAAWDEDQWESNMGGDTSRAEVLEWHKKKHAKPFICDECKEPSAITFNGDCPSCRNKREPQS